MTQDEIIYRSTVPGVVATELRHDGERRAVCEIFRSAMASMDVALEEGREKALVMTKLEEAMHWALAGIARKQNQ